MATLLETINGSEAPIDKYQRENKALYAVATPEEVKAKKPQFGSGTMKTYKARSEARRRARLGKPQKDVAVKHRTANIRQKRHRAKYERWLKRQKWLNRGSRKQQNKYAAPWW